MEKLAFLKKINLFAGLGETELKSIIPIVQTHSFANGEIIFEENSEPDNIYMICSGKIKIIKKIIESENKVLATLNEGEFLGELSIFDNLPRSASAMAYGENGCIIYSISKSDLIEFNYNHPHIMNIILQNIILTLSERMRKANEQFRDKVFWGFAAKK